VDEILNDLNEEQTLAVTYNKGPLLVLAGPGAGKTTVLTRRIAYVLEKSRGKHFKLLALTFTNKAAKEMKERVEELVGEEARRVFIGTFHSFSHELIRAYGKYIEVPQDFIIYDKSEDYIKLLVDGVRKRVDKELKGEIEPTILSENYGGDRRKSEEAMPDFYHRIARLKNRLIFHDELDQFGGSYSGELKLIFDIYNEELKSVSALDFPDLILNAIRLLKEKPFILRQIQRTNKHILIDEGQDTNKAQFELITRICRENFKNLFIVADEDQLIFEWNDARFEYLVSLVEKYNADIIQLYESYRCPNQILKAANRLIKHNKIRIQAKEELLPSRKETGQSILVNKFENQTEEARFICGKIKKLKEYKNICVISRNRYILENIRKRLGDISIPYYVPMGQKRFSTREMNLIINFMRLVFNENDKVHLHYICGYWGINFDRIIEALNYKTFLQNLISIFGKGIIPDSILDILDQFRNAKKDFWLYYEKLKENIIEENILDEDLLEDIELFEKIHKYYTHDRKSHLRDLGDFLNYLSLSPKKDLTKKGVALLTGHAAKGLEFDYVFLISMNQGIFPDYRAEEGSRALEEERRNCFVAVTRTKKKLFISYTKFRNTRYGLRKHEPSQFLREMGLINNFAD
jgi:DNA helicase-2/ATP-dependent DNA helicase PcrA